MEPLSVVWAKFETFAHWPGQVGALSAPLTVQVMPRDSPEGEGVEGLSSKQRGSDEYLVRFFGTYDIAWVRATQIVPYEFSKKCSSKIFLRALEEVRGYLEAGTLPQGFVSDASPMEFQELDLYDDATAETMRSQQIRAVESRKDFQLRIMRQLGLAPPDVAMFS